MTHISQNTSSNKLIQDQLDGQVQIPKTTKRKMFRLTRKIYRKLFKIWASKFQVCKPQLNFKGGPESFLSRMESDPTLTKVLTTLKMVSDTRDHFWPIRNGNFPFKKGYLSERSLTCLDCEQGKHHRSGQRQMTRKSRSKSLTNITKRALISIFPSKKDKTKEIFENFFENGYF